MRAHGRSAQGCARARSSPQAPLALAQTHLHSDRTVHTASPVPLSIAETVVTTSPLPERYAYRNLLPNIVVRFAQPFACCALAAGQGYLIVILHGQLKSAINMPVTNFDFVAVVVVIEAMVASLRRQARAIHFFSELARAKRSKRSDDGN